MSMERDHARELILNDLRRLSASGPIRVLIGGEGKPYDPVSRTLVGFQHTKNPELILLAPLQAKRTLSHEMRTARDYARFLKEQDRGAFVFVGDFYGRSVPVFDGFVIDRKTGYPVSAVSLKYALHKKLKTELHAVLESLSERLDLASHLKTILPPLAYFQKLLGLTDEPLGSGTRSHPLYGGWILQAGSLMNLLGVSLESQEKGAFMREFRTVVDLRETNYTHDYFLRPDVREAIQGLVDRALIPNITLTLLWDSQRVIEFTRS